jgi:hypothetical protein
LKNIAISSGEAGFVSRPTVGSGGLSLGRSVHPDFALRPDMPMHIFSRALFRIDEGCGSLPQVCERVSYPAGVIGNKSRGLTLFSINPD